MSKASPARPATTSATTASKARYAERHRQVARAQALGIAHVGATMETGED
jgi:hypothetical protein